MEKTSRCEQGREISLPTWAGGKSSVFLNSEPALMLFATSRY